MRAAPAAQANLAEGTPEAYHNGNKDSGEAHPETFVDWGPLQPISASVKSVIECEVTSWGEMWNSGSPARGHGQILGWTAAGHVPSAITGHTETSEECRFEVAGTKEAIPAWITDELPFIRSKLTTPWRIELRCGERELEEHTIVAIGIKESEAEPASPTCKTGEAEAAEESVEREDETGCYEHVAETEHAFPEPAGCIHIDIIVPAVSFEASVVGSQRPYLVNGTGSGLSPSHWVLPNSDAVPASGVLEEKGAPTSKWFTMGEHTVTGFTDLGLETAE